MPPKGGTAQPRRTSARLGRQSKVDSAPDEGEPEAASTPTRQAKAGNTTRKKQQLKTSGQSARTTITIPAQATQSIATQPGAAAPPKRKREQSVSIATSTSHSVQQPKTVAPDAKKKRTGASTTPTTAAKPARKYAAAKIDVDADSESDREADRLLTWALTPGAKLAPRPQPAAVHEELLDEDGISEAEDDNPPTGEDDEGAEGPEARTVDLDVDLEAITLYPSTHDDTHATDSMDRTPASLPPWVRRKTLVVDSSQPEATRMPAAIRASASTSAGPASLRRTGEAGLVASNTMSQSSQKAAPADVMEHQGKGAAVGVGSSARERKLNAELPQVKISKHNPSAGGVTASPERDPDQTPWTARSEIEHALSQVSAHRWDVLLKRLGPEMTKVMRLSFQSSAYTMVFGDETTEGNSTVAIQEIISPMAPLGVEKYSIEALVSAAEHYGYDGEYDIAHRLEAGSEEKYIAPLREYTAHRLRLVRNAIKKAAAGAVSTALQLPTRPPKDLALLTTGRNYIYPYDRNTEQISYNKPFYADGIADVVKAAFFTEGQYTDIGLKNLDKLKSSNPAAPQELEVPASMVALAATAMEAVLHDAALRTSSSSASSNTEFASASLDTTYKSLLVLLLTFRTKKLRAYHELMHSICRFAVGDRLMLATGTFNDEALAQVEWDNIPE